MIEVDGGMDDEWKRERWVGLSGRKAISGGLMRSGRTMQAICRSESQANVSLDMREDEVADG